VARSPTTRVVCAECGGQLPVAAKFCSECGTSVFSGPERETRRLVTLLFTDVTGSTSMGEQLDPEAYRSVMGRYFNAARSAVERHGGTVEKFVGDAVLAVFGIPEVHEDDALRAVRAARELNEAVDVLSERLLAELGIRLVIRTGVNTGFVVAGSARAGGSFATGDAVNTAARLEQAAAPGEILLGATTYALVRDAVEAEPAGPVVARGKAEPVPAYRLIRVLDAVRGRRGREDLPLIGRVRENHVLDDVFARTAASARPHQITILGPAGAGKSRLVTEFLARMGDRADVAQGRCLSYGQGITYWPLVQALRDVLHLSGTESPEITRHALTEAIGRAPDRDELVEPLLALLGKAGLPGGNEQTFWSVRRLFEELASRRPVVLNIDDLHWAEPTLLELLKRLREEVTDVPLLLLCQARPELLEMHPGWNSDARASTIVSLDPLSLAETGASVAALLNGDPPHGLAGTVADWSGGNPLFIEEIVTHLVESGALARDSDGRWRVARPLDRAEPPPTVTALLTSRLDLLPAIERDLLERVSVIGLEFATAEAELMVEPATRPDVADVLAALMDRDLVRPVQTRDGATWAFKHVLVRDAAYDGMAKSLRSELHERFADELTSAMDAGDERAGFVAHHLEQAARYRREVAGRDPAADAMVDRAVEALVLAADQARDREREDTSLAYLDRALALGPSSASARREILARRVVSCFEANLLDLLSEALEDLETELGDGPDGLEGAFLRTMRAVHEMVTGGAVDPAGVSASAQELVALGRAAGDRLWIVRGLRAQSTCSAMLARWQDAATQSDEVIRIGSPADARFARALHVVALTLGDAPLRRVRERILTENALEGLAVRQQAVNTVWDALVAAADCSPDAAEMIAAASARGEELYAAGVVLEPTSPLLADAYMMNHDIDGAIEYLQRVNEGFRRSGDAGHASTYILLQALHMLDRGDPSESVAPLVEEGATYTSPYDCISVAYLAACRAILAERSGDHERSAELTAEALAAADATDEVWHRADLRLSLSVVPRTAGDRAHERRMLQEAQEMYRRKEIRSYDAEINRRLEQLGREAT
jgi:class 3 adenylate cyclase/tetratricopeptide (TPR) repeat protein